MGGWRSDGRGGDHPRLRLLGVTEPAHRGRAIVNMARLRTRIPLVLTAVALVSSVLAM